LICDRAMSGIEMRLVEEDRLAPPCRPPGDALVEAHALLHHLFRPVVPREHGDEDPLRFVRLVDRHRLVRDEVGERVGDADEQRIEALLREHLVEHVGEAPVRVDDLEPRPGGRRPLGREELQMAGFGTRYHGACSEAGAAGRRAMPPDQDELPQNRPLRRRCASPG